MPCFENIEVGIVIKNFEKRFHAKKSDGELNNVIEDLIRKSYDNFWMLVYNHIVMEYFSSK